MITLSETDGICVASMFGELDLTNIGEVRTILEQVAAERSELVVSFLRCGYFDSQALGMLLSLYATLEDRLVIVIPPNTMLQRVIEITNVDKLLTIVYTLDDALAALQMRVGT